VGLLGISSRVAVCGAALVVALVVVGHVTPEADH